MIQAGVADTDVKNKLIKAGYVEETQNCRDFFFPELVSNGFTEHIRTLEPYRPSFDNPAIVITTGSFDPIHDSHIALMDKAKQSIENSGYNVIAGVMSTGHDDYVRRQKTFEGVNSTERCFMSEEFISNHPVNKDSWLFHDNWEALFAPVAANFTTVIDWIKEVVEYCAPRLYEKTTFFYAYGADNQDFTDALIDFDDVKPIVVERNGSAIKPHIQEYIDNKLALYAENKNTMSSTLIRQLGLHSHPYVIRQDLEYATEYLRRLLGEFLYEQRLSEFRQGLTSLLSDHIENEDTSVHFLDVGDQIIKTKEFITGNFPTGTQFLSADKYFSGDNVAPIQSSRVFNVGTEQKYAEKLLIDGKNIDPDLDYVLIDDDIATGFTIEQISKHYNIVDSVSMLKVMIPYGVYDIVDERDFLVGAINGGLMCATRSGYTRFPYTSPFVNLNTRAKIDINKTKSVSLKLWELNTYFYKDTGIKVKDLRNNGFLHSTGIDENTSIEAYCKKMVSFLKGAE